VIGSHKAKYQKCHLKFFFLSYTNIPPGTLREWRQNLKRNAGWRPYSYDNDHRRLLMEHEEEILSELIHQEINDRRFCPPCRVRAMAKRLWQKVNPPPATSDDEDSPDLEAKMPKFEHTWLDRFMEEHDLTFRKGHATRRSAPDDKSIAVFITITQDLFAFANRACIINMDETCWRILMGQTVTTARIGADSVTAEFPFNPKECITASISAAGDRLPLWVICKGKTERSERKITANEKLKKSIDKKSLILCHSESGWTTAEIAVMYLQWLRKQVKGPLIVIWDLFAAHRDDTVKTEADRL
jgi:hypothetical protein